MAWDPKYIRFSGNTYTTATETVQVITDAGPGYLKAMGNRGGPHLLASDWVAIHLARWLGLQTFEFALIEVTDIDEILLGGKNSPSPARPSSPERWRVTSGAVVRRV